VGVIPLWMPRSAAIACFRGPKRSEPLEHGTAVEGHPEAASRLRACLSGITLRGHWLSLRTLKPRLATLKELQLCHTAEHVADLEAAAQAASVRGEPLWLPKKGIFLGNGSDVEQQLTTQKVHGRETYVTGGSMLAARAAVGGLLSLVDEAVRPGGLARGVGLCRPPGHHAGRASSEGFCLVNNVAVAAAYARSVHSAVVRRVLIFDWDVHHGQGTQEIFWHDCDVLFVSIHRRGVGFYPGSGCVNEVGEGPGAGYTVNIPLPSGYGDAALWTACAEVLLPAARRFRPDIILVSAGFDAVTEDPLGGCRVSPRLFGALAAELRHVATELCSGRLLLALEGGYEAKALRECLGEVVQALTDPEQLVGCRDGATDPFATPPPWLEPIAPIARSAIHAARVAHRGLPLRLMEGYSAVLRPFAAPRWSVAGDPLDASTGEMELSITGAAGGASMRRLPSRARVPLTKRRAIASKASSMVSPRSPKSPGSPLADIASPSCARIKRRRMSGNVVVSRRSVVRRRS